MENMFQESRNTMSSKRKPDYIYFPENKYGEIAINRQAIAYALYLAVLEINGVDSHNWTSDINKNTKTAEKNLKYSIEDGEIIIDIAFELQRNAVATSVIGEVQKVIKDQLQYVFDIVVRSVNVNITNVAI